MLSTYNIRPTSEQQAKKQEKYKKLLTRTVYQTNIKTYELLNFLSLRQLLPSHYSLKSTKYCNKSTFSQFRRPGSVYQTFLANNSVILRLQESRKRSKLASANLRLLFCLSMCVLWEWIYIAVSHPLCRWRSGHWDQDVMNNKETGPSVHLRGRQTSLSCSNSTSNLHRLIISTQTR